LIPTRSTLGILSRKAWENLSILHELITSVGAECSALFQVTATLHAAGIPFVGDIGFIGSTERLERIRDVLGRDGLGRLCHDHCQKQDFLEGCGSPQVSEGKYLVGFLHSSAWRPNLLLPYPYIDTEEHVFIDAL
jgi:hypothetical protein